MSLRRLERLALEPETLAARALGFLAEEPERLGGFLAMSGLDPTTIRRAARDPGFLPAVLDHLLGNENLLLAFAEAERLPPEAVAEARRALGGGAASAD